MTNRLIRLTTASRSTRVVIAGRHRPETRHTPMADNPFTIHDVDPLTLTGVVRRALRSETVEISEWQHVPLDNRIFNPVTAGLYRVSGSGSDRGQPRSWSVVLKVIRRPDDPGPRDPAHHYYWKREPLAYQSGLLDDLPAGLVAPRCFGVTEPEADVVCLWLEDVTDPFGPEWPLSRCLLAARHLGQFNGAYLAGRPLPVFPWLSRGWLRSWVEGRSSAFPILDRPGLWEHPLIAPAFPRSVAGRLQRLCVERERWLDALDQLPQTLCHWDAWRPNLFARRSSDGQDQTGAVDWAFLGIGPVGSDVGNLVSLDLLMAHVPPSCAAEMAARAMEDYLAGLRAAGWRGERQGAELGAAALSALRWGLLLPTFLGGALDEGAHAQMEAMFGMPIAALMQRWGAASEFLLDQADVARRLNA